VGAGLPGATAGAQTSDAAEAWGREHSTFLGDSELSDESACAAAAAAEHELRREAVNSHENMAAMREAKQADWEAGAGDQRSVFCPSNPCISES
jgi:hypothetical protein